MIFKRFCAVPYCLEQVTWQTAHAAGHTIIDISIYDHEDVPYITAQLVEPKKCGHELSDHEQILANREAQLRAHIAIGERELVQLTEETYRLPAEVL